jgi:hypothetical protein
MFAFHSKNHFKVELKRIDEVIYPVENPSEGAGKKASIFADKSLGGIIFSQRKPLEVENPFSLNCP